METTLRQRTKPVNYRDLQFLKGEDLGKGGYAKVRLAKVRGEGGKKYAVKIVGPLKVIPDRHGDLVLQGAWPHEKGDREP